MLFRVYETIEANVFFYFSPKLLSFLGSNSCSDANCRESDSGIFSSHYSTNTQASFISKSSLSVFLSFFLSFFYLSLVLSMCPLSLSMTVSFFSPSFFPWLCPFSLPLSFHNLLSICLLFPADSLSSVRETNSSFNNVPLNIDNPNVGSPNIGNSNVVNPNVVNPNVVNPNVVNPNVVNPNVVNPNEEKRRTEFLYPPTITVVPGSSGSLKKCSKSNLELLESVRNKFLLSFLLLNYDFYDGKKFHFLFNLFRFQILNKRPFLDFIKKYSIVAFTTKHQFCFFTVR